MGGPEALRVGIGQKEYLNNGDQVSVVPLKKSGSPPGSTARHEAIHAVVAEMCGVEVKSATIVPGPGYLGKTELGWYHPVPAVAPDAAGCGGGGHDLLIVELQGDDRHSSSSVAKGIVAENEEHIEAVGSLLEEKKTASGSEIREAMNGVQKGVEVVVFIKKLDGEERRIDGVRTKEPFVLIPFEDALDEAA